MKQNHQEDLQYESEADCTLARAVTQELYVHDHTKTYRGREEIAWWGCGMTLSDEPVRGILEQTEEQLTSDSTIYRPVVRGAALTHAWLCGSALSDTFVDFHLASMQVDLGDAEPARADVPLAEQDTFQAFSAQLAQKHLEDRNTKETVTSTVSKIFCRGTLDLSIYIDHVENPEHKGANLYTFTPQQRMLNFALAPGLEIWWRPEINRIKVKREQPWALELNELLQLDNDNDPYTVTTKLLGTFAVAS